MRWPLRLQILTPMAIILLITVGCVSALNAWLAATRVRADVEAQLRDVAKTLESTNFPLESNVLRTTSALCGAELVVVNGRKEILASSLSATLFQDPAIFAEPTDWKELRLHDSVTLGAVAYLQADVKLDRRQVGGQVVGLHIFYPERTVQAAVRQAAWGPILIGMVALALVSVAAWLVALSVTRPVHRLQDQVGKLMNRDYEAIDLPQRDDEVRDLAATVNQLAQRLSQYEDEVRGNERLRTLANLGSGIAHQVRNAATGCRIAIDLHERDMAHSGAKPDERLHVAKRQLTLIETYVQRLISLAKPAAPVRERLELGALLDDTLELVQPTAAHLGVSLQTPADWPNAAGEGDGEALEQMLVNLLINAIQATSPQAVGQAVSKFSDSPPLVTLEATLTATTLTISIFDNGPGLPDRVAEKLFQPFISDKPGGTGLGLSVARQTARQHGGDVRWRRENGLTCFWVELANWHGWDSHR
ncbi:sensor histidine kinase [Anatilimnocola floriformis]|uniref:sensor histidine kinase n=1 Tax=Anatilimnocola floriformis TaxID=2948575 RepID=UPI0020C3E29B|nr:HAMP domain-containing sensor histidine kinase [Anatilimnocola floriformis]